MKNQRQYYNFLNNNHIPGLTFADSSQKIPISTPNNQLITINGQGLKI